MSRYRRLGSVTRAETTVALATETPTVATTTKPMAAAAETAGVSAAPAASTTKSAGVPTAAAAAAAATAAVAASSTAPAATAATAARSTSASATTTAASGGRTSGQGNCQSHKGCEQGAIRFHDALLERFNRAVPGADAPADADVSAGPLLQIVHPERVQPPIRILKNCQDQRAHRAAGAVGLLTG